MIYAMDLDKIRIDIKNALDGVVGVIQRDGNGHLTRSWTIAVKRKLAQIGRRNGFEVCCSGLPFGLDKEVDWGEWLFDMCWLEPGATGREWLYRSMPFAMECEWAASVEDKVLPDFQKLVFSNAALRLLIWQERYDKLRENLELFLEQISASGDDTKYYLFAGFAKDRGVFVFF